MSDDTSLAATLRTVHDALRERGRPVKPNDIVTPGFGAHEARSAFVEMARRGLVEFGEGFYDGPGKQESEVVVKELTAKGRDLLTEAEASGRS